MTETMQPEDVPDELVKAGHAAIMVDVHEHQIRRVLAKVLPVYREQVLRDATKQDWEAKLSDLAEESIRANFTAMIQKLTDERMANLADLIRADTRAKVSAEILAERDNLPNVTIDDRIFRTAMILAARVADVGPTRAPQATGDAQDPEREHGEGSDGCEASRGRSEAQGGEA